MANQKKFSKTFLTLVRHLSSETNPCSIKEIAQDTGLHEETVRVTLRDWNDYFTPTNTYPNRYSLNVANPDARAVAKQYAHGVVSTKTKKFYCLKESEYAAALAISPNVYMQQLGNKRFIPGIDYNDKKAVKELVHQLEALIYRLMEKDTF